MEERPGRYEQGKKTEATNKRRYGEDFYSKIGRKGGKISRGGGFTGNPELAREAGRKGGRKSRRKRNVPPEGSSGTFYEDLSGGTRKAIAGLYRVASRFI